MMYSWNPGMVIFVLCGSHEHYGIYAGNDEVIHFAPLNRFGKECIHKVSLQEFLSPNTVSECYVKHFPENRKQFELMLKQKKMNSGAIARLLNEFDTSKYRFFSDAETLQRAEECMYNPKWSYSLFGENCEHFVVWCKIGIEYSHQVERFFNVLIG